MSCTTNFARHADYYRPKQVADLIESAARAILKLLGLDKGDKGTSRNSPVWHADLPIRPNNETDRGAFFNEFIQHRQWL
jgi:hypothetical protein